MESPDSIDCDDIESDTLAHDVDGEDVLTPELQSLDNMLLFLAPESEVPETTVPLTAPNGDGGGDESGVTAAHEGQQVDMLPESTGMDEFGLALAVWCEKTRMSRAEFSHLPRRLVAR